MTRDILYPLYHDITQLYDVVVSLAESSLQSSKTDANDSIELWYNRLSELLKAASAQCIPTPPTNFLKPWWNSTLNALNFRARDSFQIWETAGKPRNGPLLELKNRDKLTYKNEIRCSKNNRETIVSDELEQLLCTKNTTDFWKTWNNKVSGKMKKNIKIDGSGITNKIVDKFADFFRGVCVPNTAAFNDRMEKASAKLFIANLANDKKSTVRVTAQILNALIYKDRSLFQKIKIEKQRKGLNKWVHC